MAEFITTGTGIPTNALFETTHRAGSCLLWEADLTFSRKVRTVDNSAGTKPIEDGTVLMNAAGDFDSVFFGFPVPAGAVQERTVAHRDCVVRNEKLVFPKVTDAPDGADVGSDNVAENVAATIALETKLRGQMAAAGVLIQ